MKNEPLLWLMTCAVAEIDDYSQDPKDWKYHGDYWESPDILICTHGNPKLKTSPVKMIHVTYNSSDPHAIGKCEVCGKILWVRIVPRP